MKLWLIHSTLLANVSVSLKFVFVYLVCLPWWKSKWTFKVEQRKKPHRTSPSHKTKLSRWGFSTILLLLLYMNVHLLIWKMSLCLPYGMDAVLQICSYEHLLQVFISHPFLAGISSIEFWIYMLLVNNFFWFKWLWQASDISANHEHFEHLFPFL